MPVTESPGRRALRVLPVALCVLVSGCKKEPASSSEGNVATSGRGTKVGIVTDIGGRGDQSFNDSALRGLELWAAGKKFAGNGYSNATPKEIEDSLPPDLKGRTPAIKPLPVEPVVLQSKASEDYDPNLQLLVDKGAALTIATGYLLQDAVKSVAQRNPNAKFLLIDSPILDEKGNPTTLPNVRSVVFREEQGSFLVGALAGLVTRTHKVGFVGGKEVALIKKFEAGYRAGVMTTDPKAEVVVNYTGSFDNVAAGKQVAEDFLSKGVDIIFHGAGSDGLGVIEAVKEAHGRGKNVLAIGVDSDQWHVAPDAMLTSMVKHVDLAVYEAARDLVDNKFAAGDVALGLAEGGVGVAPVRIDFPKKKEALERIDQLRADVVAGKIKVPANLGDLASYKPQ